MPVKVVPGASRTRCLGELDGRLKVAVAAPPEAGQANKALTAFLAKMLGVKKTAIVVASGTTSPLKTLHVEGVTVDQVTEALGINQI